MTGRLVHLNGAPGAGKSTIARALVARRPGWLNCDIDVLRHLIGGWEVDHPGTGALVRPVALAMISAHLAGGHDVVLPQLLVDPAELERFVAAATGVGASYTGILLDLPDEVLADRWRSRDTTEPTTAASNRVIASEGGDDAVLGRARRLRGLAATRTDTTVLELGGVDVATAVDRVEAVLREIARGPARAWVGAALGRDASGEDRLRRPDRSRPGGAGRRDGRRRAVRRLVPGGGLAEDLPDPPGLLAAYPHLRESSSPDPAERTRRNVRDSTATLVVSPGHLVAGGTLLTVEEARRLGRPCLVTEGPADSIASWLRELARPVVLNVAGPRASEWPEGYDVTRRLLDVLLRTRA